MAQELNIEQKLNDLLVSRDFHPELTGKDGRPSNADDAKTFTFDYISNSGKNYGTMVIVLANDNEMKVMYGDNLGKTMEGNDKQEFFDFVQALHQFAVRNFWTYSSEDLSKLKYVQAGMAAIKEGLFEGYYGNRRVSYTGEPTEARMMIRHNRVLGENDARFRYVESIYIETADQERFRLPFTNMTGAKAMLEHVRQGGRPYDVRGNHICEMVSELKVLNRFNRASAGRVMEGVTQTIVEQAQAYYKSLRESLKRITHSRGYNTYFEAWHPAEIGEHESLVEDIKTMFVQQTLDTRIEAALPLLARIQQQGNAMKEAEIFESWINNLAEGTWSLPETPEQLNQLKELMSQELIVGPDATNATEQLYSLVGDDILFDRLGDLAERDPRANAWNDTGVMERLRELGIETPEQAPAGAEQPPAAEPAAAAPAPDPAAAPVPQQSVAEELNAMRKAAGLPMVEGRMLDESGETLSHIMDRFKHEVDQFEKGGDLDDDLYYALFDYYSDHGEIPYGIAKGRDGDPFEWITDRLDQELGTGNHAMRKLPEADPISTFEVMSGFDAPVAEGSCNMTAEGEYCPEHALAECGSMYEMSTVAGSMAPVIGEDDSRDKHYYQRNNIWRVMDGDELVHEYTPDRYEVVGAKKLLAQLDDEGYDVTHVISPMGTVTYLYGKPEDEMDEGIVGNMFNKAKSMFTKPAATVPATTAATAAPAPVVPDAATQARIAAAPQGYDPNTGKPLPVAKTTMKLPPGVVKKGGTMDMTKKVVAPVAKPAAAPAAPAQAAAPAAAPAPGGVQGIKSNVDINTLQKFNGIVDVPPKIKPQIKDAKGRTWTKLTGGWTQDGSDRTIDRQDSTYQSFDDAWRVANGAQPGNVGVPGAQQPAVAESKDDALLARIKSLALIK